DALPISGVVRVVANLGLDVLWPGLPRQVCHPADLSETKRIAPAPLAAPRSRIRISRDASLCVAFGATRDPGREQGRILSKSRPRNHGRQFRRVDDLSRRPETTGNLNVGTAAPGCPPGAVRLGFLSQKRL